MSFGLQVLSQDAVDRRLGLHGGWTRVLLTATVAGQTVCATVRNNSLACNTAASQKESAFALKLQGTIGSSPSWMCGIARPLCRVTRTETLRCYAVPGWQQRVLSWMQGIHFAPHPWSGEWEVGIPCQRGARR